VLRSKGEKLIEKSEINNFWWLKKREKYRRNGGKSCNKQKTKLKSTGEERMSSKKGGKVYLNLKKGTMGSGGIDKIAGGV